MGQRIRDYGIHLDTIITSTAERAQETSKLIAKEINYELDDIDLELDLYHAPRQVFINILCKQPERNILIVGHNPGIQDFSYWLSSEPTVNFPTCGVIHISLSLDNWTEIYQNSGKAIRFEYPRMFS
jgi:phosphohistidine phosphatase